MDFPPEDSLRWIVTQCAGLRAAHAEAFADVALVEPTGEFFPDDFRGDAASLGRLVRRMISYAPISDELPLEIVLLKGDGCGDGGGGCGSGSCGAPAPAAPAGTRIEEVGDGYRWFLDVGALGHPHLLTAALARGVGHLVRLEAGEPAGSDAEAEVTAVMCGFGALLLNGAEVWAKSCGGLRSARATSLPVNEVAVALALFLAVHGHAASRCRAHLEATQREALDVALDWAASNEEIVEMLRVQPALLEAGLFDLQPVRGMLGRWFHRRRGPRVAPAGERRARTEDQQRRLDEARALVDEVLGAEPFTAPAGPGGALRSRS